MPTYNSGDLAHMLRRTADGLPSAEAAVEMLIGHQVWLTRGDFTSRYIEVETGPVCVGDRPVAFVRWKAAVGAVKAGRLVCTGSEAAMLKIAASIAEGISVDLRDALGGLDAINLGLVLEAVARANGRSVEAVTR